MYANKIRRQYVRGVRQLSNLVLIYRGVEIVEKSYKVGDQVSSENARLGRGVYGRGRGRHCFSLMIYGFCMFEAYESCFVVF